MPRHLFLCILHLGSLVIVRLIIATEYSRNKQTVVCAAPPQSADYTGLVNLFSTTQGPKDTPGLPRNPGPGTDFFLDSEPFQRPFSPPLDPEVYQAPCPPDHRSWHIVCNLASRFIVWQGSNGLVD